LNHAGQCRYGLLSQKETAIKSFAQKAAFITGGASGIGLGMARAFAEQGMAVALADINAERLGEASKLLTDRGTRVVTCHLDITDKHAVKAAVDAAAATLGGLNIVCANAGVSGMMGPLQDATIDDWDWVLDVNLKGAAYAIQAAIPHLLKHPGDAHIVITSSISGLRVYQPSRGQGMYNTAKYGLVGMGEALKVDLEPAGVGVSILCPSVVNTDISHSGRNRPEKYGGKVDANQGHELAKAAGNGTDPLQFGRWVVKAIMENRLYVITHPVDRELVEARHDAILAAFDSSDELTDN